MQKSESIKGIAAALVVFHTKVGNVKKDATNPFFGKKYATLSNILEVIQVPLAESGISFTQFPTGDHGLTTMIMHSDSGEYMSADYVMEPVKNDPQSKGSVITYQRRYALCAVLGLNIEDDDDGNKASQPPPATGRGAAPSANNLPWLNDGSKEFDGAVKKLLAGTTTIAKIKTVMRLSKAVEAKLIEQSKPTGNA